MLPLMLTLGLAAAADAPISTDRPGNANAATVVPEARFQVETSANVAISDGREAVTFPTLFRFGLFGFSELRLGSSVVGIDGSGAEPTDTLVGAKFQISKSAAFVPDLSLMADVFLPSGNVPFTNDVVVPELRAAAAWGLPAGFGLLLNLGLDLPEVAGDRFSRIIWVANLGYSIPIVQQLSVFVEGFGQISTDDRVPTNTQFDAGVAFLLTDDVQLDSFIQVGDQTDFQVAAGVSFRL